MRSYYKNDIHGHKYTFENVTQRNNLGLRFASNQRERINIALDINKLCDVAPTKLHEGNTHNKLLNLRPRD